MQFATVYRINGKTLNDPKLSFYVSRFSKRGSAFNMLKTRCNSEKTLSLCRKLHFWKLDLCMEKVYNIYRKMRKEFKT